MGGQEKASSVKFAVIVLDNMKVIYADENGDCVYVQENPPGISRPCEGNEHQVALELPKMLTRDFPE